MSSKVHREDGRVRDADVREPVYSQVRIDDAAFLAGEHRAAAARVELGSDRARDERIPIRVGGHARPRAQLLEHDVLEWGRAANLARQQKALSQRDGVRPVATAGRSPARRTGAGAKPGSLQ